MPSDRLLAALQYAKGGYHVIPCRPGEKRPSISDWPNAATTDEETIRGWWSVNDYNVGIVCGSLSGVVAIDCDNKGGLNGLSNVPVDLTTGPAVVTPTGGMHYYTKHPGGSVGNSVGIRPGVDIRADGGFVVAPPSIVNGVPYRWHRPMSADKPLYADLREQYVDREGYAEKALRLECESVVGACEGSRNATLNTAAFNLGQLVGGGSLTYDEVESGLFQSAISCGLGERSEGGERQIRQTIDSGIKAGQKHPRYPAVGKPSTVTVSGGVHSKTVDTFVSNVTHFDDVDPTPTDWLFSGLVPNGSCIVVGAEEKTGKSWLSLAMAICGASGKGLFDEFKSNRILKTLIVSPEGSKEGLRRRMYGVCWGLGVDPRSVGRNVPVWNGYLDLTNQSHTDALKNTLDIEQPDILLIDPLVSAIPGVEENSTSTIQPVLNLIRGHLGSVGSIIITHHVGKMMQGVQRSDWHQLRGSSAIGAWADGLIFLRKSNDDVVKMRVSHRDDPSPPNMKYRLVVVYHTKDGVPTVHLDREFCDE